MTLNLDTAAAVALNFEKVQELRNLEDETLSLSGYCKSATSVLEMLKSGPSYDF